VSGCALCRSDDLEIVQTQSLALLNQPEPCRIDFCVCRACGHLQQSPPVTPERMAHYYRNFATYEVFGDAERLRTAPPSRHAQRFLALVSALNLSPGRAYEVGCASGAMLHQFSKAGWQVSGCDPSPSAISQAREIFGMAVDLGDEEHTLAAQKNLDLILVCHVLEHLYDPPAALARFHAALAPDGHLVLEVPCATNPESLPPGWFTFEHLHYYQPDILERLLRDAGFAVIETRIDRTAQHYPVIAIAARKMAQPAEIPSSPDPSAGIGLAHCYAARDRSLQAHTALRIARIRQPVFVYGAGIHTAQMLDQTDLGTKVIAFADRDSKKWGQTLANKPVISPSQLLAHPSQAPIVISSYVSEKQILQTLLEAGAAPSRLIPLYSEPLAVPAMRAG
jgi:SAM-dependent methyltransferase